MTVEEWVEDLRKKQKKEDMEKEIKTDALRRALQEEGKKQAGKNK